MPRRKITFINEGIYHVFNRGVEKRKIFLDSKDYKRFINLLSYYKLPRKVRYSQAVLGDWESEGTDLVEILAYCLMPNHFHLLLRQKEPFGISKFLRLVQNGYTKYFNIRNKRSGHLLQGIYKATHIFTDEQLVHVLRYIHLNPFVAGLTSDPKDYSWSSHKFYLNGDNELINSESVLSFFKTRIDYEKFVSDHADYAKTLEDIKHEAIDY